MAEATRDIEFQPGRFGRRDGEPGLNLRERTGFALATVVARRDQVAHASRLAEQAFGVVLPDRPQATSGREVTFLWSGAAQWFALAPAREIDIETRLAGPLSGSVAVFDQSDSRVMLELWGPRVRDVLAKGFSIDLDPPAFRVGDVALTSVSHLNVLLWQAGDEPRYRIFVIRTWFGSFWRWLAPSAAGFGGEVLPPLEYAQAEPIASSA